MDVEEGGVGEDAMEGPRWKIELMKVLLPHTNITQAHKTRARNCMLFAGCDGFGLRFESTKKIFCLVQQLSSGTELLGHIYELTTAVQSCREGNDTDSDGNTSGKYQRKRDSPVT